MIFVTVGNATQGFTRLLEAVDALAGTAAFQGESVYMQTGHNDSFKPRHSVAEAFLPADRFLERMKEARLIICHGGCGTLLQAIAFGKIPVVMPRLSRFREHVNDHQIQLVRALAEEKRAVPVYEVSQLLPAIQEAWGRIPEPRPVGQMQVLVGQAIDELLMMRGRKN
jgi:UDP-N-acetylglucosamine transferase subunit ALG13